MLNNYKHKPFLAQSSRQFSSMNYSSNIGKITLHDYYLPDAEITLDSPLRKPNKLWGNTPKLSKYNKGEQNGCIQM
jgi:hypothetical protein